MDWIKIDDRLPKERELVIIYAPLSIEGYIEIMNSENHEKIMENNDVTWAYFAGGLFVNIGLNGEICRFNVTHWMPMPDPPKE